MTMYRGAKSFGKNNNKEKGLLQKAVLTFLMTGVVAWPSFSPVYAGDAQNPLTNTNIVRTDGVTNVVTQRTGTQGGLVTDIYVGKMSGNTGINKFSKFDVLQNDVANLRFNQQGQDYHADNLVNVVNSQININGTVNALRDNKVGGHVYFLSPNGMVVGAGGAINAGALTVVAPVQSEFDKINSNLTSATDATVTEQVGKIITPTQLAAIPLNPSATIVVQGKINTTGGVNLRAGQIYVGTDGNGNHNKAEIKSGMTSAFPVNLDGQATMDGELTAVTEGEGDISLVADVQLKYASSDSVTAKIVVDGGSEINSANDVTIMAKVENNANASEYKDDAENSHYIVNGEVTDTKPDGTGGFMADRSNDLSAVVEIGKNTGANITAQKDVKIQALVENNFATSILGGGDTFGLLTEVPAMIYSFFSSGIDGVFGFLESSADVEIGQNTIVHSEAGNVDIKAQAKNNLTLGANVSALNMLGSINASWNIAPSAALNIGSSKTDATVKVDGTVTADAGRVDIEALGDNTFDGSAVIGAGYGGLNVNQARVAVAVDAGWGHNNVKVEIGSHANITAKNDLAVRATAKNALTSTSKIKSSEKNDMAFVVDVMDYDSFAEVDVAGDLTSEDGNLYVTATDDFTKNSLYASAWGGATGLLTTLFGHDSNDNSLLLSGMEPFLRLVAGKLPGEYFSQFNKYGFSDQGAPGEKTALDQILDKIKAGISVGVMDEDNRAVVNIAKTADLTAAQKVDLHARVYHHELTSRVAGSATVSSTRQDTAATGVKIMAGGAILIRDVDNTADVILEGRDDGTTENISGSSVSITAQTRIESHNVQSKIDAFQDLFGIQMNEEEFKNQFRGQGMDEEDLNAIWLAYKNYKDLVSEEFFEKNADGSVAYGKDGLPKVKQEYQDPDGSQNQQLYEKMKTAMANLESDVSYKFLNDLLQGKDATYTDSHGVQHTIPGKDSPDSFIGKSKQLFSKIKDVIMDVVDAISLESWVDFNVGAAVSNVYKGENENPKFAGDFVLGIDDLSNTANIIIGKNNELNATGDIKLKTDTFLEQSYFDGKLAMLPFFADLVSKMNSAYGLNLMIGLREFDQNSMIVAAENVQFTGQNLTVEADTTAKIVGITEYMVTGASTSAIGSVAIGLPTFVNNNLISLDDEVKINVTGEVKLTGKNNVSENLIGGGLVSSGKASGALIVHVFNQERNNLVIIGDNDEVDKLVSADEKVPELVWTDEIYDDKPEKNKNKDTDEERIRKLIAINLLADDSFKKKQDDGNVFNREKAAGLFGTANVTKSNEITAGSFYSSALNEGEIVTAVADVALSITGGSLDKPDDGPGFFSKLKDKLAPAGKFFMKYVAPTAGAPIYWPVVGLSKLGDYFTGNMNSWLPQKPNVPALEYPPDNEVPPVSLTGAGSVNVNTFKVRTASVIDGVKITLTGHNVTVDNVPGVVYDFSNIASDTTGMVNVAGSAAAGTKGYSKGFTTQYNDAFNNGGLFPAEDAQKATLVTMAGAAAVGILVNDLTAQVKESKIVDAHTFCNEAIRDGHLATAAAAVALSLSSTFTGRFKETTSVAMAGGISLNFGDYSTVASLQNNLVTGTDAVPTDLFNLAQTQDIQVTGGIDIDVAKGTSTTVGLGAVVSYAAFTNDVTAEMKDDGTNDDQKLRKYSKMGRVENIARSSLTQAAMAVGIGIALESGTQAQGATVSLQGAAAVNNIANNVFAVTDGVTIDAQNIQVLAYDYKKGAYSDKLTDLEKSSIKLFRDSQNEAKDEGQDNVEHYYEGETTSAETLNEQGNLIITGGVELSLALGGVSEGGSGSAGAALGISIIDNNFVADVQNSNITLSGAVAHKDNDPAKEITAYPARVLAESNTEKWGVVAGANASRNEGTVSVTIGGSILLDFINNDALAKVDKSNVTTDGLCLDAYNKEKYVNATGYFDLTMSGSDGNSVGIGLGIVYNKTLNNTAARLLNTDVSAYRPETGSVIGLYADSDTDIYAFALGAGASNYGLTANVAVNVGQTNVEAVAEDDATDGKENVLNYVKELTVHSKDDTYRMAIAGNVNIASTAALGAALTWNRIGHQLTADDDVLEDFEKKDDNGNVVQTLVPSALTVDGEATQTNRAKVSGYQVVTLENAKVDISAVDTAKFTTISVGAILVLPNVTSKGSNLGVEGANANSMIDKTTLAELENCVVGNQTINSTSVGSDKITVDVNASTDNKSLSSADVLVITAGSGDTRAALGAAVVENTIGANTQANVTGTYGVNNMLVKSISNQDLDNYAFGVAATTDFALGGSVVVNTISGDTSATIGKADASLSKVNSSGSLGVIAESYEELTNGSGQLAASGSGQLAASGGGSVAVNSISGDTLATITNAEVAAWGGTGAAAYAHKDSADMKRRLANETLSKPEDYVAPTYTGLIVGADAFHHLKDVTACGVVGISKAGGISFGIDATVAVDKINGSTKALVTDTDINKGKTTFGNVNVLATDALESYSKVINGAITLGIGGDFSGNIGAGVLVNNNNRIVQSGIGGTDVHVLNVKDLTVSADSYADVDLLNVCASIAVSGSSGSVVASVTSADVKETTDAYVNNMSGTVEAVTVQANHEDDFDLTGSNMVFSISTKYVGVGIGVQVTSQDNKAVTNAAISGSTLEHNANGLYDDIVRARNISDTDIFMDNLAVGVGGVETYGLAGVGIGVMVVDNDLEQITLAKVNNSRIGSSDKRADDITVEAVGDMDVNYQCVNAAVGTGGAVGVATVLNGINTTTRADVIGSQLYAKNNIIVNAEEEKDLLNVLAEINGGAIAAIGVPVIHNYIGMDIDTANEYAFVDEVKENIANDDGDKSKKENALDKIGGDTDNSCSGSDIKDLTQQGKNKFKAENTTTNVVPVEMAKLGVVANISGSTLDAVNKVNITTESDTVSDATMLGGQIGALNVLVPVNRQRIGQNTSVNMGNSTVIGKNGVTISSSAEGNLENHTTEVAVTVVGILVTTTELTKQEGKGTNITVGGTTIKTEGDLNISTSDTLSLENHLTQVAVGASDFGAIVSTTKDNGDSKITLKTGNTFIAQNITAEARSTPRVSMDNTNVSVTAIRGSGMINKVSTAGNTTLTVEGNSSMQANEINLQAQLLTGSAGYNLKSDIHAVGVSVLGIGVDKSRTYSDRNVTTQVGAITLSGLTDNQGVTGNIQEVNIGAYDGTLIDNYIRTTSVGVIASESNFAQSRLNNSVTTSVDTGVGTWSGIGQLNIGAESGIKVKAHSKASSGSTIDFQLFAADVENTVTSNVITNITGNYEAETAVLKTAQTLDMDLVAEMLAVHVIGGSGTFVDNTTALNTKTNITDAKVSTTEGDLIVESFTDVNMNRGFENTKDGNLDPSDSEVNLNNIKETTTAKGNGVGVFDIDRVGVDSTITTTTENNITKSTLISAGDLNVGALTAGFIRAVAYAYTVNAFGGVRLDLDNTVTFNDTDNISGSTLKTKNRNNINIVATDGAGTTNTTVTTSGYGEITAGIVGGVGLDVNSNVTRNANINVGKKDNVNSTIYALQDVNLLAGKQYNGEDAHFSLNFRSGVFCGQVTPFRGNNHTDVFKQNYQINVGQGSEVKAIRDVTMYAYIGDIDISEDLRTISWAGESKVTVPVFDKDGNPVYEKNKDGSFKKDKNGNMIQETEKVSPVTFVYFKDGQFVDKDGNVAKRGNPLERNNFVQVDGTVTAGVANCLTVDIGEKTDDALSAAIVVVDDQVRALVDANGLPLYNGTTDKSKYITFGDAESQRAAKEAGLTVADFEVGTMERAAAVDENLLMLKDLALAYRAEGIEYNNDGSEKCVNDQEVRISGSIYDQLMQEVERMSNVSGSINPNSSNDVYTVDYIKLPDMVASGGNVNVTTDYFHGNGTVEANGDAAINVNNKTNLMLVTQRMNVDRPGGMLIYNGEKITGITNEERQEKIKARNKAFKDENTGTIGTVKVAANVNSVPSISVLGEFQGNIAIKDGTYTYTTTDGTTEVENVTAKTINPQADILITGDITCLQGDVTIQTKTDSIFAEAPVGGSANVVGKTVSMVADTGSIVQGFTPGIVEIGGSAKSLYQDVYKAMVANDNSTKTNTDPGVGNPNHKGRISGEVIYLAADDINVNGIIQSGYQQYTLAITEDDADRISQIKSRYGDAGSTISDAVIMNSGDTYLVRTGGIKWNSSTNCYDYEVPAYFNPSTNTIVVPSVDAKGGKITLVGRISSTGNGEIICQDGAYNINVTNNLGYNLKVNNLLVNDAEGVITIADTSKNTITEIYKDKYRTRNVSANDFAKDASGNYVYESGTYNSGKYNPTAGLAYSWVEGQSYTLNRYYEEEQMATWWGAGGYDTQGEIEKLREQMTDLQPYQTDEPQDGTKRKAGSYIALYDTTLQGIRVDNTRSEGSSNVEIIDEKRWSTGLYGCHKRVKVKWVERSGVQESHVARVAADQSISYKFIGVSAEDAQVSVTSNSTDALNNDIILSGDIGNTKLYETTDAQNQVISRVEKGTVNITGKGSVTQEAGSIYGLDVVVKAGESIEGLSVAAGDSVNLDAWTSGKSNVDATVRKNQSAQGVVYVGNLGGAQAVQASLTADGNIFGLMGGIGNSIANVVADRIDLTSKEGQIGTSERYMVINAGQEALSFDTMTASASAHAKNNIYLQQVAGDLRVGTIWSDGGDVNVKVATGGIVDALSYAELELQNVDQQDLVNDWVAYGIADDGSAYARLARQEKYDNQAAMKEKLQADLDNPDVPEERKAKIRVLLNGDTVKDENGNNVTLGEWRDDVDWVTTDQMLYALQDAAINHPTGVVSNAKDPNLYGKNIYLYVKNNAGIDDPTERVIALQKLSDADIQALGTKYAGYIGERDANNKLTDRAQALNRELATADAATVTWNKDNDDNLVSATIVKKLAIGLQQNVSGETGQLVVTNLSDEAVAKNVYLEGRVMHEDNRVQNLDLRIGKILANGDIRLTSLGNLYNSSAESIGVVTTDGDLLLSVGDKEGTQGYSIGTQQSPFKVVLAQGKTVEAMATDSVWLTSDGDLLLAHIGAGNKDIGGIGNINISATNIYGYYDVNSPNGPQTYLESETDGTITLTATGSIGSKDDIQKTVRVKNGVNNPVKLSLSAGTGIVLETVSTAKAETSATAGKMQQAAEGSVSLQQLTCTAGDVVLTANGTLNLQNDITLSDEVNFTLNINESADLKKNIRAGNITINATNSIALADDITLQANTVTFNTDRKPDLTYGTMAMSKTEGGIVYQGNSQDYNIVSLWEFYDQSNYNSYRVFSSTSKIVANQLLVNASKGIFLGGKNDCNDVMLHNSMESVVYHNVADENPGETGDVLKVAVSNTSDSKDPVVGSVWIYNQAITPTTSSKNFAKPMEVTSGIYALYDVMINSDDSLTNLMEIISKQGDIYLSSELATVNRGMIKAEKGFVAIGADDIYNYADMEAKNSIFLLSSQGIYNGEQPTVNSQEPAAKSQEAPTGSQEPTAADIHMYAGNDIVLLSVKGLDNRAQFIAGAGDYADGHGGNVFLDDFEIINASILPEDTKTVLQLLLQNYWETAKTLKCYATIKNSGEILAYKGDQRDGRVYIDSQGMTENDGFIYSVDGDVFMDSSEDLVNHKDIYVLNTDETGTVSCNVTLQATGNVYNTGDIHVQGKGTVLLDADAVDDDKLDLENMSPSDIVEHLKTSEIEGHTFKGVYNTGDIYASDGDVTFKSMYGGDIYNTDALNTVLNDTDAPSSIVYSQGSIALLSPMGHITNTKALYATKNITIECVDDLYNAPAETLDVPSVYAGHTILRGLEAGAGESGSGDLKLISHSGVIYNDGILKATRGDVIVDAGGAKVFNDVVFEVDSAVCPVPLSPGGRLQDDGKIVFEDESYSIINTKNGDVMVADGNIVIHGQSGVLTLGDMYALHEHVQDFKDLAQSQVDFMAAAGNIETYATGIAEGKGNISLVSDVGDVFVYSVNEQDEHDPEGHWFLSAQDFTLRATGGYDADGHEIGGFVYNDKGIKADFGSVNLTYGMGVNVGCTIESIYKDVTIKTTRGSAVIASAIKAGSYINLEVGRSADDKDYGKDDVGTLVILDNPGTGTSYLQATDGITLQAADSIFVRDKGGITTDQLLRLYAFGDKASDLGGQYYDAYYAGKAGIYVEGNVSSTNGDIDVGVQHGNLALSSADGTQIFNVVAHNGMTSVGTHDANITVDNLEGEQVILYTETPEARANFNTMTVGEKLVLAVNNLDMDMSKVIAYDRDKPYEMDIYTVGNPVEAKICLDYSKCDVENIEIQQMNVGQAEIVANAPVKIDELSVANRADIYAMGTKTSVYGFMHEYDAANDITYYNEGKGGVGVDLSDMFFGKDAKQDVVDDVMDYLWKYETGATGRDGNLKASTMALDIKTAKIQDGNAILLGKDRGYSVYNQRYSVESLTQDMADDKAANIVFETFNTQIQFFNRFDNVDIPEVVVNQSVDLDKDEFEF